MKTAHDLVMGAKGTVSELSVVQAVDAIRQCDVLIDVREADEFAQGHLPNAVHMSRGMLEFKLSASPLQDQWACGTLCQSHARDGLLACGLDCWRH